MSAPGFAPGPWELVLCDGGAPMVAAVGDVVCIAEPNHEQPDDFDYRNFRLISAAPELYEALTDARDAIASLPASTLGTATICDRNGDPEYYPIQAELLDKIDCALAKARGDQ